MRMLLHYLPLVRYGLLRTQNLANYDLATFVLSVPVANVSKWPNDISTYV